MFVELVEEVVDRVVLVDDVLSDELEVESDVELVEEVVDRVVLVDDVLSDELEVESDVEPVEEVVDRVVLVDEVLSDELEVEPDVELDAAEIVALDVLDDEAVLREEDEGDSVNELLLVVWDVDSDVVLLVDSVKLLLPVDSVEVLVEAEVDSVEVLVEAEVDSVEVLVDAEVDFELVVALV